MRALQTEVRPLPTYAATPLSSRLKSQTARVVRTKTQPKKVIKPPRVTSGTSDGVDLTECKNGERGKDSGAREARVRSCLLHAPQVLVARLGVAQNEKEDKRHKVAEALADAVADGRLVYIFGRQHGQRPPGAGGGRGNHVSLCSPRARDSSPVHVAPRLSMPRGRTRRQQCLVWRRACR